jgi:hypothetical protein
MTRTTRRHAGLRRKMRRPLLVTALCAASLALPASAMAGQDSIWWGTLGTSGKYGPRHSLSSVWATYFGSDNSCFNALNANGTGWAGDTRCAWANDTNVGHPYCACQLRYGFGFSSQGDFGGTSTGDWRQFW